MNKVLETLNDLGSRLASVDTSRTIEEAHYDVFPIIRKALTPPTADEVCEALQKDCKIEKVIYDNGRFYDEDDDETIVRMWEDGTITFDEYLLLNLKTLSLIIRFYEGLGK